MLTINDEYRLEDFGMKELMGFTDPSTTPFYDQTMIIPNRPGAIPMAEEIEPRALSIPVKIQNDGQIDIDRKIDRLAELFYDDEGKRKEVKLSIDHWSGKYVNAYLSTNLVSDRRYFLSNLTLDFICYDPHRYSEVLVEDVTWGSETITFEADYLMGHTGADGLVTVDRNRSYEVFVSGLVVYPEIEIQGSANNLRLSTNGETIDFPNFTNSTWKVERYNAWQNGQERFIDARRFKLNKGSNQIEITGSNLDIQIRIKARDRYK